jgi:Zn-dependent M28 family amino/carboxypeptidase
MSSPHSHPIDRRRRATACLLAASTLAALSVSRADGAAPAWNPGPSVERILQEAVRHPGAYRKLEVLCDQIGHRLSGSAALDRAVRWAVDALKADGLASVRAEPVKVPHWVRGHESLALLTPNHERLPVLGLGGSVGTPPGGLEAEVVVVRDEAELKALGPLVRGRILLFNNAMPRYSEEKGSGYGDAVRFRWGGARLAATHGAVAALIRSVTAHSLRSPHTGSMGYGDAARKIPAAAVTIEDADRLDRLFRAARAASRPLPRVHLTMGAETLPDAPSANVVAELPGSEHPEEIVLIGAHLDSWDVGQGAHDDGAGTVTVMEAVALLKRLGIRPRRTIRVVLFTNEENGLAGGKQYAVAHAAEVPRHVAAIESDSGGFAPTGFGVEHIDKKRMPALEKAMAEHLPLLAPAAGRRGAIRLFPGHSGADLIPLKKAGVVSMELFTEGRHYFDYHHTQADTLDKVNPSELARCVGVMAAMAFLIADAPGRLDQAR